MKTVRIVLKFLNLGSPVDIPVVKCVHYRECWAVIHQCQVNVIPHCVSSEAAWLSDSRNPLRMPHYIQLYLLRSFLAMTVCNTFLVFVTLTGLQTTGQEFCRIVFVCHLFMLDCEFEFWKEGHTNRIQLWSPCVLSIYCTHDFLLLKFTGSLEWSCDCSM